MTSTPLLRLTALFIGLLLCGCCANNVCNCDDAQEDAIQLRFSTNPGPTGQSFVDTDLDTIIIQRFPKKFTAQTVPESVTLLRTGTQVRESIELRNGAPFAQVGSARLNQYRYVVQYLYQPRGMKPVATRALVIDSVLLKGSYDGNGCCTCYHNTAKSVYRDGDGMAKDIKENPVLIITK